MLVLVDFVDVDAEERVGQVSRECRIGQSEIDDEGYENRKRWRPAPFAAADVGVLRPNYSVMIFIPVLDVLLNDLVSLLDGIRSRMLRTIPSGSGGWLHIRCLLCHLASREMRPRLPLRYQRSAEQNLGAEGMASAPQSRAAQQSRF